MSNASEQLKLFITLAKAQAVATRHFSNKLSTWGLGFSDFMILYFLGQETEEKMRRIDLAEKIGLTASGVTRMLAPMEKIGLIKREPYTHDARVSIVALAPGGKRLLAESFETAEYFSQELLSEYTAKKIEELNKVLASLVK